MGLHFCWKASLWCRVDAPSSALFCYWILPFCHHSFYFWVLLSQCCGWCSILTPRGGGPKCFQVATAVREQCVIDRQPATVSEKSRRSGHQPKCKCLILASFRMIQNNVSQIHSSTIQNNLKYGFCVCAAPGAVRLSTKNQTSVIVGCRSVIQTLLFLLCANAPAA